MAVVAAMAVTLLTSCDQMTIRRLDEAVFYEGPRFTLKLVRYYENLLLHYSGEIFVVQCASARTASSPGHKTQDAGWVQVWRDTAIGSKSAKEVVERERARYLVMDENTLVWTGGVALNLSFDACGSIRRWVPTALPAELIDPAEKPSYCAPKGTADCAFYDFQGDRAPRYEEIRTSAPGRVSFLVRSKAFKGVVALRVQSTDFGKTWAFTAVEPQ